MTFTPDALKAAAAAERQEIESRVRGKQGGLATYFDIFFCGFLDRLTASESEHGWNADPEPPHAGNPKHVARLQWLAAYLDNRGQSRFVPYEARHSHGHGKSDIRSPERMMSQGRSECLSWRGMPLFKSVFDFALSPMLIWELKPASIFEIGSGTGASACWMADTLGAFGLDTWVYSADINPVDASHPRVRFIVGDCMSPETLFGDGLLRSAPHPWLIIEDAHENVRDVLLYLDGFLTEGDYLFVEDSLEKHAALTAFLTERPDRYLVDTYYTDFFGRNATSAVDSILVRV